MKINFLETIQQKTERELQIISKDVAFYSDEERIIALNELERRGNLPRELTNLKKQMDKSMEPYAMPDSVSISRIYSDKEIWTGSMLGGPLVAGYLIAENFKAFNEPEETIRKTWIYTILGTIFIFVGLYFIPEEIIDKLPNYLIPFLYTAVAAIIVEQLQKRKINAHFAGGGRRFSWGRVILIGLIGGVITIVFIFLIYILLANL